MKFGNIPEKITLFIRPETDVAFRWEDVEGGGRDFKVRPAYISDSSNKKTLETGKSWAENDSYYNAKKNEIKIVELDNKPFYGLQIVTLEIRDKGGRAYKVATSLGEISYVYFDARECIILDTIFEIGISKGGLIDAEFIFAKVGSQMMPVRVGSYLHSKMVESTKYDEVKPIGQLEIGGIYKNKRGDKAIYLGQYWVREPNIEYSGEYRGVYYHKKIKSIIFGKSQKLHVFHNSFYLKYNENEFWFHKKDDIGYYAKGDPVAHDFQIVKKHSYKEKVGQTQVPDGYIELTKEIQIARFTEKKYKDSYPITSENGLLGQYSKLLTISDKKDYIHPLLACYKNL